MLALSQERIKQVDDILLGDVEAERNYAEALRAGVSELLSAQERRSGASAGELASATTWYGFDSSRGAFSFSGTDGAAPGRFRRHAESVARDASLRDEEGSVRMEVLSSPRVRMHRLVLL